MQLIQLNIGQPAPLSSAERTVSSGIRKRPVTGPVTIGPDGCAGDG
jgi:MOSC domain-containing protein YiiM